MSGAEVSGAAPRRWLPWMPWTATVGLVVSSLVLPANTVDVDTLGGAWFLGLLLTLQALTFATVGLVLARARPDNSVSWLFSFVAVFVALYLFAERYQYYALTVRPGELPFGELTAWLQAWLYVPALAVVVSVLPQLFPTGRPVSRRWHAGLWLAGLALVGIVLTDALAPGRLSQSTVENPFGIAAARHELLAGIASTLYLLSALVGFASLLVRWRRAGPLERQQLKWFAYFAALIPVFVIATGVVDTLPVGGPLASVFPFAAATGAFLGLPIGTAISILRYRLYDIDLVIKRTLVYGALSALLVAVYLGLVLLLRLVLSPWTGESDLEVAGSTLAVAALFRPLRSRIQSGVDRRFYRARYDAGRTLEDFSTRLRDELDLQTLGTDLRGVVHDTMQPSHVTLWLRDEP